MALTGEAMPTQAGDAAATACRHVLRLLLVSAAALAAYLLFGLLDRAAYADTGGTVLDPLLPVVSAVRDLPIIGTAADVAPVPVSAAPPAAARPAGTPAHRRTDAQVDKAVGRTRPASPTPAAAPPGWVRVRAQPAARQPSSGSGGGAGAVLSPVLGLAAPLVRAVPTVLDSSLSAVDSPLAQVLPGVASAVNDLVTRDVGGLPLPTLPLPTLPLPTLPTLPEPGQLAPPAPGGPADPLEPAGVLPREPHATEVGLSPPDVVTAQRLPGAPSLSRLPASWPATVTVPIPRSPRAGAAGRSKPDGGPPPSRTTHEAGAAGAQRSGADNIPTAATIAVPWHPVLLARGDGTRTRSRCSGRLVHHGRLPG